MRALVYGQGTFAEALATSLGVTLCVDLAEFVRETDAYCTGNAEEGQGLCVLLSSEGGDERVGSYLVRRLQSPTSTRRPRVILLGTFLTWAGSSSGSGSVTDPIVAFSSRVPASCSVNAFSLENALFNLSSLSPPGQIEIALLPVGLIYGDGGWDLEEIFKRMWDFTGPQSASVVLNSTKNGTNRVPMIHFSDLSSTVADLVQRPSLPAFSLVPLSDGNTATLQETFLELARVVNGADASVSYTSESDLIDVLVSSSDPSPQKILLWNVDLSFDTSAASTSSGIVTNFGKVWNEFLQAHALKPVSIVMAGNPKAGKTEVGASVAETLQTALVNTKSAVTHVLQFPFPEESAAALALRGEILAIVEAKASEGKKAPPKKGEVDAPAVIDPKTVEVTDALCASILPEVARRCVSVMVQTDSLCIRKGFVLDLWDGALVKSAKDVDELLGGSGGASDVVDGDVEKQIQPLKIPELMVELQCADAVVMQRYLSALGVPEGGLAKSSKENQAAVKTLEGALAAYASSVKLVEPKLGEDGETPIPPVFPQSHELVQELERDSQCSTVRLDAAALPQAELSSKIVMTIVKNRGGVVGWLPELTLSFQQQQQSEEGERQVFSASVEGAEDEEGMTQVKESEAPVNASATNATPPPFTRLRDRSINDLNDGIAALSAENKTVLLGKCGELQEYLLKNIMPFIVKGMVAIVREKPDDPIGFMADFLKAEGLSLEDSAMQNALANFDSVLHEAREVEARLAR